MISLFIILMCLWALIGVEQVRFEKERGNEKLTDLKFKDESKILLRASIYGPLAKTKFIAKL
jgi:hypothetical protein